MHTMTPMSSTFFSSTHVTLWFGDWTTTSTAAYLLTLFFLFSLGILHRFLSALKSQLEMNWKAKQETWARRPSHEKSATRIVNGHARQWSRALRHHPVSVQLADRDGYETEPLSPTTQSEAEIAKPSLTPNTQFWIPSGPWNVKKDGISAGLEFTRALIGYILMLAVMTYNIGILFAVTGSVLLGELILGRYTRSSAGLAEDTCHS